MTRQTSIAAYHQIKEEGLLSKLRFKVYEIIVEFGPLTAQEAWHIYRKRYNAKGRDGITPRFSELERFGVIAENKKRPCSVTGRTCIEWIATDKLPIKPKKELTNIEKIKRLKKAYRMVVGYAPAEIRYKAYEVLKNGVENERQ